MSQFESDENHPEKGWTQRRGLIIPCIGEVKVQLGRRYVTAWCIATLETYQLLEQQKFAQIFAHIINHEENEFQTWKIAEKMKQLCKLFSNCPDSRFFFDSQPRLLHQMRARSDAIFMVIYDARCQRLPPCVKSSFLHDRLGGKDG